ncbi:MAG: tRNA uridine(34) 5-carboxymethylaminomethyl modification radical SAM/GNAT enzyme Elp3 [Methanomassiliicoccales archaeon]
MDGKEEFHRRLISLMMDGTIGDKDQLQRHKLRLCRELSLGSVPPNSETLSRVREGELPRVEGLLRRKPVRTMSGVAVVAAMTSPHDCPHGRCLYCPGGVSSGSPQSYTGKEPAARRGERNGFDPHRQVKDRLDQLAAIGHPTGKVDLIIMGGTFTSRPVDYQEGFVKGCFDAMNSQRTSSLEEAHRLNEGAPHRCIGMTVETRPDHFVGGQVDLSMALGATRVELGVQILDDDILAGVERGHGVREVADATRAAKERGLKVCYHIMPGLPGSSPERDLESFRTVFSDPRFRPDMLKIYPTLVVRDAPLYEMWRRGDYRPYSTQEAVDMIARMKSLVPPYVRIQRIQRDIPVPQIEDGVDKGHLRQLVQWKMKETDSACRCIRCREVGLKGISPGEVELNQWEYQASAGREIFLSLDTPEGALVGFLRLRFQNKEARVRELKVFGPMVPLGSRGEAWQHRGHGKRLMERAESLALERGASSIKVTSGVGVRPYYRAQGYRREGAHMVKRP